MPTDSTDAWNALQARLWSASKMLGDAEAAYNRAQANARNLVSDAEQSLTRAINEVRKVLDVIASTPPGTYPNNIDHPPS
ncbi:MAG TPA: hypothetical protein VLN42_09835 [Casimicrobiaceae bacterium]|nr:hypothetical protein [Casimicrobiaceae bacterium]